jgi:hypothetical protein
MPVDAQDTPETCSTDDPSTFFPSCLQPTDTAGQDYRQPHKASLIVARTIYCTLIVSVQFNLKYVCTLLSFVGKQYRSIQGIFIAETCTKCYENCLPGFIEFENKHL